MTITGIDAVTYGVADVARARRFFDDWGLKRVKTGAAESVLETRDGTQVVLRPRAAKGLPKAVQRGSTVREITWGVKSRRDLQALERELARDRDVTVDKDGALHAVDPMGFGFALRVSRRRKTADAPLPMNSPAAPSRVDRRATYYDRARPRHIGHCVFNVPDLAAMQAFYTERLGFFVSDHYTGRGVFLRCAARGGHHNLFCLQIDGKAKLNHVAFAVRDIHEMFAGGLHQTAKGWKTAIGPGRHHVSSCYFWYFRNPAGGMAEYFCDEDYLTEAWKPGDWDPAPETFAEWVLASGLPRSKALPPTRQRRAARAK